MSAIIETVERSGGAKAVSFTCPGCGDDHVANIEGGPPCWAWNGSLDRPTLSPSLLVRCGHYMSEHRSEKCWCTYNAEHPDNPAPFTCYVCHSFVSDGQIKFLGDSTHALAGQTVDLPELPENQEV